MFKGSVNKTVNFLNNTKFMKTMSGTAFGAGFKSGLQESFGIGSNWYKNSKLSMGGRYINEGFLNRNIMGGVKGIGLRRSGIPALGLGLTAFSAYQGFQEGGVFGAAKDVGQQALFNAVTKGIWRQGASSLGFLNAAAIPMALGAAAGYASFKVGQAAVAKVRRYRNLEMGGDLIDTFGTISTMRQRSLNAIQNSHVNGRFALGGEGALMHTPYMR